MSRLTDYEEAAAVIEAFIDGRSGKWNWDDFTSIKKKDEFLESVRLRCVRAYDDYPAKEKGGYCSADGIAVLRALAQEIREKISSIQNEKRASPVTGANEHKRHGGCYRTRRASCARGSSITLAKSCPDMRDEKIKLYDIKTNAEWQKLGATAESRTYFTIEEEKVPAQFRPLIPYVVRWAISCDVRRGDYFEKQSPEDIADFYRAVTLHLDALTRWVDEPPFEGPKVAFLTMLKAYSEAAPRPPAGVRGPIMGKKK